MEASAGADGAAAAGGEVQTAASTRSKDAATATAAKLKGKLPWLLTDALREEGFGFMPLLLVFFLFLLIVLTRVIN